MAELPQAVDGFASLLSGVHTDLAPELLNTAFFARGINVSVRNGLAHCRPGFTQESWGITGTQLQGAGVWSLRSGDRLVVAVDGKLYAWSTAGVLTDLGSLFANSTQAHFCQVDRFMVAQDGESFPVVLNESEAGAPEVFPMPTFSFGTPPSSDPADWTVPVWPGTVMAYVHGRLHLSPTFLPVITNPPPADPEDGRPYFISGDIALPSDPSTALFFTETEYLSGGGAHSLPQEMGDVTALTAYRNSSSGTGYGALLVFARRGVCAFDVSLPRSQWSDQQLGQVLFFGSGTVSPWSVLPVNNDVIYRGPDGMRTLGYTASQVGGQEGILSDLPLAAELGAYFRTDAVESLPFVSSAVCNNRLFMTVGGSGRHFKALGVLDLAPTASYRGAPAPMFPGVWQLPGNRQIAKILTADYNGVRSLYVIASDLTLWRLNEDATTDDGVSIRARVVTRGFSFSTPVVLKRLKFVELGIKEFTDDVNLTVRFRPVGYPLWGDFSSRLVAAPAGTLAQGRRKLMLPLSSAAQGLQNTPEKTLLHVAQRFQFMLEWTGSMEIDYFRVVADYEADGLANVCDEAVEIDLQPSSETGSVIGEYFE